MTKPSCLTCPGIALSDSVEQEKIYGKTLGVHTCPRTSTLLGTTKMTPSQVVELSQEVAEKCKHYGKPNTGSTKTYIGLSIGIRKTPTDPPPAAEGADQVAPKSCRACTFYVPANVMRDQIGVGIGLCSQFGRLVPETKTSEAASKCSAGVKWGAEITDRDAKWKELLGGIAVDPRLRRYISLGEDIEASVPVELPPFVEPHEYETDAPVTAGHQAKGIRAWRKLSREGRDVYLPIFDPEFFDENERAKIPRTGDDEHPEKYMDHLGLAFITTVLWRELDETPALHGVAGTGKTEFFRYMAWMMCLPFERISITSSTELDDLAGKTLFEDGATVFQRGRIPRAWSKPCVIVLDEPNVGSPAVWQFIRPLTDNSKQLVLDMNKGETILRDDHAYMGMAMNPAWDVRNVGAETISDADGSRLMHIFVDLPDAKMERQIIRERCALDGYEIEDATLNRIMGIAADLRKMSDDETLPVTWGIRNQIKVARATKWFDLRRAYQLASADYLEPAAAEIILDVVKAHA